MYIAIANITAQESSQLPNHYSLIPATLIATNSATFFGELTGTTNTALWKVLQHET